MIRRGLGGTLAILGFSNRSVISSVGTPGLFTKPPPGSRGSGCGVGVVVAWWSGWGSRQTMAASTQTEGWLSHQRTGELL